MNSIVNHMAKYDHRQHVLSDWLAELEQRFQLGEVTTHRAKITWCQLLIGATGSSILASLEDEATWETAKETLLSRLGAGSVRDEAWASLKRLTRGSKEIIELACPRNSPNVCISKTMKQQKDMRLMRFSVLLTNPWQQRCKNWEAAPWKKWCPRLGG